MTQTLRRDRDLALSRLKYEMAAYRVRLSMLALDEALSAPEEKFNPNHDPANGRFTSGSSGGGGGGSGLPAKVGGLLLNKDGYLAATKTGLWRGAQGAETTSTGFSNNSQAAAAAARAQDLPDRFSTDLSAPPDVSELVTAIAPATVNARISCPDQDYEKFLTFGRDANGEVIVTSISIPGKQGGDVSQLIPDGTIAVAHVRQSSLISTPTGGDDSIAKTRNIPSFVITGDGRQVFEVGRTKGVISIRSVRSGGKPGPWEAFQSSGRYRHYGDGS